MNVDPLHGLPVAAPWSLWAGQVGNGLIWGSIGLFLLSILFWALQKNRPALAKPASLAFTLGSVALLGSMACLGALFVNDQFQYQYIWSHSDTKTPLKYKIAAIWTAQEGSFLLWACSAAIFGLLTMRGTGAYRRWYTITYAGFLASVGAILAYETPFQIMKEVTRAGKVFVPQFGTGMVPSLQNYWVIIHPPTIFLGFGSLTVLFAYAVAAMMTKNPTDWVRQVRPWTLVATAVLGLGLCMGGLWAYETLGWGGFWAWDPVENVSFVPWLFAAALIHGVIVQVARGRWVGTNLLLAGLPFLSFVYGTFLTRSGLLDQVSVHSFASMDKSALTILKGFLILVTGGFFALYFWRGRKLSREFATAPVTEAGVNREGLYRFGILMLSLLAFVIAVGMSWPVITALRGGKGARIEEWLYHQVVVWFFIPTMLVMAVAPFVSWRAMGRRELIARVINVFSVSIGLTGFSLIALKNPVWGVHTKLGETIAGPFGSKLPLVPWMVVLIFVCLFVAVANVWRVVEMSRRTRMSSGGFVSHFGLAVLLGGLILSRGFEQKEQAGIQPGDTVKMLDYTVTYRDMSKPELSNRDNKVLFDIVGPEGEKFTARPGLYYYDQQTKDGVESKPQVWPHVERQLSHDIYFNMRPPVIEVWETPQRFKPGETRTIKTEGLEDITITYAEPTMSGQFGSPGAKFGAKLFIKDEHGQHEANPYLEIVEGGLRPSLTELGHDFLAVLGRMDAADRSIDLKLMFKKPIYPVDLYYKPMTGLVWVGTGILTLGGLMSAFARRFRRQPLLEGGLEEEPIEPEPKKVPHDAPVPAT